MVMLTSGLSRLALLAGLWLNAAAATACNVPVFRYALEHWRADRDEDRYQVTVFHRGPLAADQQARVQALRKHSEGKANLAVETVDLVGKVGQSLQKLWKDQKGAALPWVVLRYPGSAAEDRTTFWTGPLSSSTLDSLAESPMRREIARRLLSGDSIVWLLLECGDPTRDDAAAALLDAQLRRLEEQIQLPELTPDDSDRLLSRLPLRLVFSSLRLSRKAAEEQMLVAMLLHSDDDLADSNQSMVFPIFGRGRALDPLIGKGINADTLTKTARFLCEGCSCQVKRLNPGIDLLTATDWDAVVGDEAPAEPKTAPTPGRRVSLPPPPTAASPAATPAPVPPSDRHDSLLWAAIAGAGVMVVLTGAWVRKVRSPRS
jgi:hypothetical protein